MKSRFVVAVVAAGALFQIPVAAHPSFAAEFDQNKPVTLTGKLTKMEWTNPHGWIFVDVTGPDGKVVNWAIESGSPNALIRRGLRHADREWNERDLGERQEFLSRFTRHRSTTGETVRKRTMSGRPLGIVTGIA